MSGGFLIEADEVIEQVSPNFFRFLGATSTLLSVMGSQGPSITGNDMHQSENQYYCGDYNDHLLQLQFAWPWHHLLDCEKKVIKTPHLFI